MKSNNDSLGNKDLKKNNSKRIYIINYNTIVYAVIFLILVLGTIYFMSKCMGNTEVTIQSSGVYDIDQANTINAVANNVIGRINNTIAVSAIFFTVIVASISVFQFIKIKDLDNISKKVVEEAEGIQEKSEEIKGELEKTKTEFNLLKIEYENLDCLRRDLEKKSSSMQVDFNIHKIDDMLDNLEYNHKSFNNLELRNLIVQTIDLADKYPGTITNVEKARLQFMQLKYFDTLFSNYIGSIEELYRIWDNIKNEECGNLKLNLHKEMIGVARQHNDTELEKEIINKMGTSMDEVIDEIITNTTYGYYQIDISEIERTYSELADFFGDKFFEILIKETKEEYFNEVLENIEFKDFFMKFIDQKICESRSSE